MVQCGGQLRLREPLYDFRADRDCRDRQIAGRFAHFLLSLGVSGDIYFPERNSTLLQIGARQVARIAVRHGVKRNRVFGRSPGSGVAA